MAHEEFLFYLRQFCLYVEGVASMCPTKALETRVLSLRSTINQYEASLRDTPNEAEEMSEEDRRAAKLAAKLHTRRIK